MEGTNDMMNLKHFATLLGCFLVAFACSAIGYHLGTKDGVTKGIKAYHKQCYTIGGYIIDDMGHVVACMGQGQIPKEELPNFKSTI